jgi:large subunit ribosomal protein L21
MYAIIQAGGNQYKVQLGETFVVDLVDKTVGDTIKYPALMVVNGEKVIVGPEASKIEITAKVIKHFQGEKLDVFRYKSKVRYRKRKGFRPQLSLLEILAIGDVKFVQKPVEKPIKQEKVEKTVKVEDVKKVEKKTVKQFKAPKKSTKTTKATV